MMEGRFIPVEAFEHAPGSVHKVDPDADLQWFIGVTNVRAERKAAEGIERAGLAVYLPVTVREVIRSRRKALRVDPLMPRYLFIGLAPGQSFYALRSITGFESLVRFDGVPVEVPQGVIAAMAEREIAGEFDQTRRKASRAAFSAGQVVTVTKGPFSALVATVAHCRANERVGVLLDLLGRKTLAEFDVADLRVAE